MRLQSQILQTLRAPEGQARLGPIVAQGVFESRAALGREVCAQFGFVDACGSVQLTGCLKALEVLETEQPIPNRLIGLPGYFGVAQRFTGGLANKAGEPRTTGSIAYELAMTARGVMQYAIFGAPRMWDMAGGALAVQEAGGTVMTRFKGERQWHPIDSFVPTWDEKTPTMKELRDWTAPLVAGNHNLAPLIANNVRRRFSLKARLRPLGRAFRGKSRQARA